MDKDNSSNISPLIKEIKGCLEKITLKELASDPQIQNDLWQIKSLIDEYFSMVSKRYRAIIIKTNPDNK